MAIDPICGMTVDERKAISAERDGKKEYFCSEHCRRKFLAGEAPQPHEPSLVSLDAHFQAPKPDSLNSQPSTVNAIYTCPMHPEIEQDHPGTCPKCGMALEPKTLTAGEEDD